MARQSDPSGGSVVSLSALDIFANALGAVAFLLLLFAATTIQLARPSPISILTEQVPSARSNSEYLGVLAAKGGVWPYEWSIRKGSLPEGLELDPERGEIHGFPAGAGGAEVRFQAEVRDSRGRAAFEEYELRVLPARRADQATSRALVLLTRGELPRVEAGRPYSLYLSARGGSGEYDWIVEELPEGLSVDARSGLIAGTPEEPGRHELVLRVRDPIEGGGELRAAVATAMLEVVSPGGEAAGSTVPPPRILTTSLPGGIEGEPYAVQLSGRGMEPLRWSAEGLPAAFSLSEQGELAGTPEAVEAATIRLRLLDGRGIDAPAVEVELTILPRQLTAGEIVRRVGIWVWLGYLLLGLLLLAFFFLLQLRAARDLDSTLRLHGVELIKKPDGTAGLSGPPDKVQSVQSHLKEAQASIKRQRTIAYVALAIAVVAYTLFVLR